MRDTAGSNKKSSRSPGRAGLTKSEPRSGEAAEKLRRNMPVPDPVDVARQDPYFFRDAPVSIWVEDFSEVRSRFEALKKQGVRDMRTYLSRHPEEVVSLAGKVKIIDVNNATLELYRARDKNDFFKGLKQIFSKASYDTFREGLITLAEGRRVFTSQGVNLTLTKEGINLVLQWFVPADYENSWSRVIIFVIDISSLRMEQKELLHSEEKYRSLFESINEAVFLADPETGFILEANRMSGDLIGIPPKDIIGMHFTQFHSDDQAEYYQALFQKHARGEVTVTENVEVCHASGKRVTVSIISSTLSIGGKKYISAIFRKKTANDTADGEASDADKHGGILSARECEIVKSVAAGLNNHQIAKKYFISESTVKTHRMRIMKKLKLHKTAELVMYAVKVCLCGEK